MLEWILVFIFMILMALLFTFLGFRIWKREQITLIHDYHYTKVADKYKKPYTEQMGKACIIIGIGIFLTGIGMLLGGFINIIKVSLWSWVIFGVFFMWGFIKMIVAQKKYNGGVF